MVYISQGYAPWFSRYFSKCWNLGETWGCLRHKARSLFIFNFYRVRRKQILCRYAFAKDCHKKIKVSSSMCLSCIQGSSKPFSTNIFVMFCKLAPDHKLSPTVVCIFQTGTPRKQFGKHMSLEIQFEESFVFWTCF